METPAYGWGARECGSSISREQQSSRFMDEGRAMTEGPFIVGRNLTTPRRFVAFWEQIYRYPDEASYTENIGHPLTAKRVRQLYKWKNGTKLSELKAASVDQNFVARIDELGSLPIETPPEEFLNRFSGGGAIWRIYWLHLWQPRKYPIYDQHVHRAMTLIEDGQASEIPAYDPGKIRTYLERFVPFFHDRFRDLDQRRVDRALWACGKYMKPFVSLDLPACT